MQLIRLSDQYKSQFLRRLVLANHAENHSVGEARLAAACRTCNKQMRSYICCSGNVIALFVYTKYVCHRVVSENSYAVVIHYPYQLLFAFLC